MRDPVPSQSPPPAGSSRRVLWLALAMAVVAVLIRLPHLGWGLPDLEEEALPLKKAFEMWGWNEGTLQLDPHTAGWPSLSFYVHLLLQHLVYLGGRLSGAFANRDDVWLLQGDLTPLVLAARAMGVLAAAATVAIATRIGARLAGIAGGLLCGGALAVSPLLVEQSRLITPDILLTLCAALAVARIVDVHERGALRDHVWAGIWIGLGISVKYSPILLAPALFVVHVMRRRQEARAVGSGSRTLWLGDRRLLAATVACVLAFAATSPFLLRDLAVVQKDFASQFAHMSQGHFGQEKDAPGVFAYLTEVLAPAFGWPGLVIAVVGLGWASWRRRGVWLVPAICAACLYLGLSFLQTRFDRYLLPLLLPLSLGLAAATIWWAGRFAGRPRGVRAAAVALLALVVLIPPTWTSARILARQGRQSTLQLAKQFLVEMPGHRDLTYAMEAYTPRLPADRSLEFAAHPVFARLSGDQRRRLLAGPAFQVINIPMYAGMTALSDLYYDLRHYLPVDVVVTSSSVRGRYERDSQLYGRQVAFYRDLEQFARRVATFPAGEERSGPEIRVYRFDNEGRARLLRERGRLEPGFYRAFEGRLHAPHFHAFLEGIADAAYAKQMYGAAELYYQALDETTAPDAERPWLLALASCELETGQPAPARDHCLALLRRQPGDYQAEGVLASALEALGDFSGAALHFKRCLDLAEAAARRDSGGIHAPDGGDPAGFAAWARGRLATLGDTGHARN